MMKKMGRTVEKWTESHVFRGTRVGVHLFCPSISQIREQVSLMMRFFWHYLKAVLNGCNAFVIERNKSIEQFIEISFNFFFYIFHDFLKDLDSPIPSATYELR